MRCNYCGRFMKEGYVYTPWGSYHIDEPPEDEFICLKCFTPDRKKFLDQMWCPPMRLGEEQCQVEE